MNWSVVMPIHNEERYLPYSLPSVYKLKPSEVVLIFDKCEDKSLQVAKEIAENLGYLPKTKFLEIWEECDWVNRVAWIRRKGFELAKNDTILNTDADTILDPRISDYLTMISEDHYKLVVFSRRGYGRVSYYWYDALCNLVSSTQRLVGYKQSQFKIFSAIYLFSKRAWLETEERKSVKKIFKEEDRHLQLGIMRKYKNEYVSTKNIHLREELSREKWLKWGFWVGRFRYSGVWRVIWNIAVLRFMFLVGFLQGRTLHTHTKRLQKTRHSRKNV